MIQISNLSKSYKNHQALTDVSISIPKGSIYGLIGHNGAGKTTLIRILTQILKADSGRISIDGETLNSSHRLRIGYLPEERGLYKKMTVYDYLEFIGQLRELKPTEIKENIIYWLQKFDLESNEKKEINALSKGNQQKVQFIATVFFNPDILILDEPFSGFDPANAELLKNEILELNKKGVTILFSTHQMEAVEELCQELSMIDKSKIVLSGNLKKIKQEFGNQDIYLKTTGNLKLGPEWNLKKYREGWKITLRQNQSKKQILETIDTNELLVFEEIEPSLKDIFLKMVQK